MQQLYAFTHNEVFVIQVRITINQNFQLKTYVELYGYQWCYRDIRYSERRIFEIQKRVKQYYYIIYNKLSV